MKRNILFLFLLLLVSGSLIAQIKYTNSVSSGAYTALTGGTLFTWGAGSGTDDRFSEPTPIGFTFNYNGEPFTEFQVSTEGFIRMGSGLASSTFTNALNGLTRRVIAPYWDDMDAVNLDNITFQVSGTEPNRVLTVEWKEVKWPRTNATGNASFQVKLFETSGNIVFHYGTFGTPTTVTGQSASIGLSDNTAITTANQGSGTFLSIKPSGVVGDRRYHKSMGQEFNILAQANMPDDNTIFTFMPASATPIPGGTYTVGGTTPDYPSLSDVALALNTRGIAGSVTFNVRAGTYDDVLHLLTIQGATSSSTVTIKNESGEVIVSPRFGQLATTAPGAVAGDAMFRLEGTTWTTIDGFKFVDNALNTTTTTKFNMAVLVRNYIINATPLVNRGARFNTLKNLSIDMEALQGAANVGAMGIRYGTTGAVSADTSAANSYNTIQDVVIEDFWRAAIQMYGHSGTNPDRGNSILGVNSRTQIKNVNINSGASNDIRCIEVNAAADLTIQKVDIMDIVSTVNTTNQVKGIWFNPASGTDFVGGNVLIDDVKINKIHNAAATATTGLAVGFETGRMAANSVLTIKNSSFSDIYANGTTGRAEGILISPNPQTGFTAIANVFNNLVYDIRAPRSTTAPSVRGMDFQSTAGNLDARVYFNTILIDNSVPNTAGTHQSAGIYWANYGTSFLDLRNNIVVNTMVSGTRATALYASANSNLLRLAATSNNNLYFAGTPSATNLIAYDGATGFQTLGDYKAAVASGGLGGPREVLSVTENPPFVSATSPYNLNIQTTVPTQAESGGQPITGITTDFAGTTRNANFPDIGAFEFTGIAIDNNPPLIAYTNLGVTHFTTNRTLVAQISDPSGVAGAGNSPRLYYRKSVNDAWVFDATPAVSGNEYTFTFNYASLPGGSVSTGDTIFYYVAAQDANGIVGTNPAGGSGSNPPGTTAPGTPRTYMIQAAPLSGTYIVSGASFKSITGREIEQRFFERTVEGTLPYAHIEAGLTTKDGQPIQQIIEDTYVEQYEVLYENGEPYRGSKSVNGTALENAKNKGMVPASVENVYPTLAAAVADLNLRGVSGHVTFLLNDAAYTTPTLTINITYDSTTSANRTVTFKPNVGVNATVTANSTSPVFVVGSSYVTIDGSNTVDGTTRNLTIENTNAGASAGVAFFSNSAYSTVKNIVGAALSSAAGYGIVFSGSTFGKIYNNEIKRTTLGIQLQGFANNTEIKGNFVGATADTDKIQNIGIAVLSTVNFDISNNYISGLLRTGTSSTAGIVLGIAAAGDDVKDGNISNNYIKDVKHTGTGLNAYAGYGIRLSGNTAIVNSNIKVFNNVITDIWGDGDAGVSFNPVGIYMSQGAGYQLYFNSVNMFGNVNYSGASAAATAAMMVNSATVTNLDIRNNVLQNSQTVTGALGKSYSFYSTGTNATFADINYNDYYSIGANAGFNFLGTTAYANLVDWQAATTKDANSKAVNPQYTDSLNLRPTVGSGVFFAGTPIAGITTDHTGTNRTNTPSMGAYEFPTGVNIGWANLQWPLTATVPFGGSVTVYGQIWVDGVTNSAGQAPGINAWLGYSTDNTNPNTWTNWIPATYNTDVGNNDEYQANIGSTLLSGTYYYAYRYQLYGGAYYYGGTGGEWNGTTSISGVLTVQDPPLVVNWENAASNNNLPAWFNPANSNERGIAYGMVNDGTEALVGRLVIPSRTGGNSVRLVNDSTGADVGTLNVTGITGGLFQVNDAEVDHKGRIYVCNMTTDATNVSNPFKVYRWSNVNAAPEVVVSWNSATAVRLGDKFKISWDSATNGIVIWAASSTAGVNKVYKWTQIAGLDSFNQVPVEVTLSDNPVIGAAASVGPLPDGSFYWKSNGNTARKYQANGTIIDTIPGGVVASGANALEFIGTHNNSEFFVVFQYGAGNQNARVVEVPNGNPKNALTYGITPPLGTNANVNGTGDVAVKHRGDGSKAIFVLGTNNGFGSYNATQPIPVELNSFAANVDGRNVELTWKTATETNTSNFVIERKDNEGWKNAGSVSAAGNSTQINEYSFVDRNLNTGKYSYRLKMVDLDGTFEYSSEIEVEVGLPQVFSLSQNYPNPFNPTTKVDYTVPFDANVNIEIFDITGQRVATLVNNQQTAGYYTLEVSMDKLRLSSGVYIYRMLATELSTGNNFTAVKKMMLLK